MLVILRDKTYTHIFFIIDIIRRFAGNGNSFNRLNNGVWFCQGGDTRLRILSACVSRFGYRHCVTRCIDIERKKLTDRQTDRQKDSQTDTRAHARTHARIQADRQMYCECADNAYGYLSRNEQCQRTQHQQLYMHTG